MEADWFWIVMDYHLYFTGSNFEWIQYRYKFAENHFLLKLRCWVKFDFTLEQFCSQKQIHFSISHFLQSQLDNPLDSNLAIYVRHNWESSWYHFYLCTATECCVSLDPFQVILQHWVDFVDTQSLTSFHEPLLFFEPCFSFF